MSSESQKWVLWINSIRGVRGSEREGEGESDWRDSGLSGADPWKGGGKQGFHNWAQFHQKRTDWSKLCVRAFYSPFDKHRHPQLASLSVPRRTYYLRSLLGGSQPPTSSLPLSYWGFRHRSSLSSYPSSLPVVSSIHFFFAFISDGQHTEGLMKSVYADLNWLVLILLITL